MEVTSNALDKRFRIQINVRFSLYVSLFTFLFEQMFSTCNYGLFTKDLDLSLNRKMAKQKFLNSTRQ